MLDLIIELLLAFFTFLGIAVFLTAIVIAFIFRDK